MQQQRFRRLALFIGASALVGGGLIVAACGTDNGTTATPQIEASAPRDGGGGGNTDDQTSPDTDGGGTDGALGADCANAPKLRSNTKEGGFFCAFYKADAAVDGAAGLSNCTSDQTCCNPAKGDGGTFDNKFPPSFCADGKGGDTVCQAQASAHASEYIPQFFANSWECNDKNNCANPATDICVMTTAVNTTTGMANVGTSQDKTIPASCKALQAFKEGGSKCKTGTTVAANEVRLCSSTDNWCGAGTTCTPFDGDKRDLGTCR